MSILNINWKPEFGAIFTWFAMDKNGKIAVMINNCYGYLPKCLLSIENVESLLDHLNEYMWEESSIYSNYPKNKKGNFKLDLYSYWRHKNIPDKKTVLADLTNDFIQSGHYSDVNLAINKGFFEYQAIEGSIEGEDYPIGYEGVTKMGDYFRYLMPTVYASIEDFPEELRHGIAVSDTVDFTTDRLLDNDKINEYFLRMYKK
ncbi:hypothetical protein DKK70_00855 [Gilliamella apicola]|uniref:Uncharacterized protein n=1 Tax=Gilliamella apicola TaxID=1196095 RepID=A0A2V4EE46_9GAMM|nr:hypothetical protein [Gilliamella apicola]PXZ08694.1 hypothetical protein DKK70_00855 [Gilliamella apicola]